MKSRCNSSPEYARILRPTQDRVGNKVNKIRERTGCTVKLSSQETQNTFALTILTPPIIDMHYGAVSNFMVTYYFPYNHTFSTSLATRNIL